jgi:YfiH family protein
MMLHSYKFKHFESYPTLLHSVSKKSTSYPYSCSLALHTGEEKNDIITNRKIIIGHFSPDTYYDFVMAQQTHSDNIHVIKEKETRGLKCMEDGIENCDALLTDLKGVMIAVVTADCIPILLYDKEKKVIAAVHAGWKGTKNKIVYKTVQMMIKTYNSNPKNIIAGIAPSIGSCCYEVGEDVAKHFFSYPQSMQKKSDKYMLDLPYLNKIQLKEAGLIYKNIEMSNVCTSCNVKDYFSYRKEKGCSGRFMSMIALKSVDD